MAGKGPTLGSVARMAKARAHEYTLVSSFKLGYRHREDVTNLPPGVLIVGSKNVQTNVSERVQMRQGYAVDGPISTLAAPVASSFDWLTRGNTEKHLRAGGLSTNDGKLQYRYVATDGTITWRDLLTGLSSVSFNFTSFWETSESLRVALFVNGQPQIQEWNGATAVVLSSTSSTITKTGTDSWADAGFYVSKSGRSIVINGNTYPYTGGENTTTLTGVSPIPTADAINGAIAHQSVVTTANSALTGPPATFANALISTLNNQVFLAALNNSTVWISKVSSYVDYSSSTPRQSGEGASLILDSQIVAFIPQENYMYVSAGKDLWYNVSFSAQSALSADGLSVVTYEQVNALPLKTGRQQGALSQASVSHMKNNVIMISNEPTIDMFGRLEDYFGTPQTKNISDPIKLDVDAYDFTGASIAYWKYYILVAVPAEGLVLTYSLNTNSWDAPHELPITRFYIVDGDLYGHSSQTFESYHLFTGYADRVYPGFNGYPINAIMKFSYQNFGTRFAYKSATALYIEGYIGQNTSLNTTITYEVDGCATVKTLEPLDGSNTRFVCLVPVDGSLGKNSLGKIKLGGNGAQSLGDLPPKFRYIPTFSNTDFFETSVQFQILGVNQNFQILAFGFNISSSSQEPVSKKE